MLNKCREIGLSLKPEKCQFVQPFIIVVGHIVSTEGVMVGLDRGKVAISLEP